MIVVSRFTVPEADSQAFAARGEVALAAFAARPGYVSGRLARSIDDPTRWVMVMEWDGVGAYRRSLSAYDVKVAAVPLLAESIDEPAGYEVLLGDGIRKQSDRAES